jgi:phosphohistidine phosphatase
MIVGHNPGQENLIRELTGRDERFPTAALAQIDLPIESWKDLELNARGKLVHLWLPKELDNL